MITYPDHIIDRHNRVHNYLRLSITEKCNLRCTYCMPAEGINLSPRANLMSEDEIIDIVNEFVSLGVTKVRLTGGEPLVRKDARQILDRLSELPIKLALSTNGILLDEYIDQLVSIGLKDVNVSLDTLDPIKFQKITRREGFDKVVNNIIAASDAGLNVKVNVVLMKGENDDEILDFVRFSSKHTVPVRFIEFMPFQKNRWDTSLVITERDILEEIEKHIGSPVSLPAPPNSTSNEFSVVGTNARIGMISTVTNPFCDSCNRIRLTADGKIKNCLFSKSETDILTPLREGLNLKNLIQEAILAKHKTRGGMSTTDEFADAQLNQENRSMIRIGG